MLAVNEWLEMYQDSHGFKSGDVVVDTILQTGYITVARTEQGLIKPCIVDAEQRGLVFCRICQLSEVDEITGKRQIQYTAVQRG